MNFLRIIAILSFFLFIFSLAIGEISCFDVWLHLKTGEYILKNRIIPRQDIFSYTFQNKEWIDHEWLFQAILYSIYSAFGINGLIFMKAFIISSAFFILFLIGYRRNLYLIIILLLLGVVFLAEPRFIVRPELFTMFFTAVYFFILSKYRSTRLLFILPIIQLFWANMHGYFFVGIAIIFIFAVVEMLRRRPQYKRLIGAGLLVVAASFINPYGWKGAMYPFVTLLKFGGEDKIFFENISELTPLVSQYKLILPYITMPWFKIIVSVSVLSFLMNFRRLDLAMLILYIISLATAVKTRRNIVIFSFIAYVATIININSIYDASRKFNRFKRTENFLKSLFAIILIIFISVLTFYDFNTEYYSFEEERFKNFCFGVGSINYPKKAIDFIEENDIRGNILNDFNSGAYLIWRLFPKKKVFIDGRTEVYGPEFFNEYKNMFKNEKKLNEALLKYNINCILFTGVLNFPFPTKILKFLYEHKDWALVYLDDRASVFLKNRDINKAIIDKSDIAKRELDYHFTDEDIEEFKKRDVYPRPMIRKVRTFLDMGLYEQALKEAEYALRIKPDCIIAYQLIASCYVNMEEYHMALDYLNKGLELEPDNIGLHCDTGFVYTKIGNFEKALELYKRALILDPLNLDSQFLVGKSYNELDEYENAIAEFEKMLEACKKRKKVNSQALLELYTQMGIAYEGMGKDEEAEQAFSKASELNPNNEDKD